MCIVLDMMSRSALETRRILLVDGDAKARAKVAAILVGAGFDVVDPGSGPEALSVLANQHFDVLVTEVLLPEVDGVEIVQAVRKAQPRCRIVAISGGSARMPAAIGLRRAEAFGADVVLYKPFGRAELLAAVGGAAPAP